MKSFDDLLDRPGSSLEAHLRKVSRLSEERFVACLGDVDDDNLLLTVRLTGLCHDLGKGTSYFQDYIKDAENQRKRRTLGFPRELAYHSRLGAEAAAFLLRRRLGEENPLPLLAYGAILRHHGSLGDLIDEVGLTQRKEVGILKQQLQKMDARLWEEIVGSKVDEFNSFIEDSLTLARTARALLRSREKDSLRYFFLGRLLYSCLLWADRADASGTVEDTAEPNPVGLVENYRRVKSFDKPIKLLDDQRNRAYEEVVEKVRGLDDSCRFFTLSLPTGLGKTLTGLAAALELRKKRGLKGPVIYCLPFTTIIDQNAKVYREVLENNRLEATSDRLLIHHHLAETTYRSSEKDELDPDKGHLLIEGWESDLVVTTFVQLGLTLFGNHNRSLRRLHRLANAVVILDEVQNIPVRYWSLFRQLMHETSGLINTHWILMTATQPVIFSPDDQAVELVEKKKGFFEAEALSRTVLHNEAAESLTVSGLAERIMAESGGKKVLVVVNTVRCAVDLFNELFRKTDFPLFFLSSEVIPQQRLERIEIIKKTEGPLICVSTQLIEAGVDISFELVYRDLAPLDSVIQAAGRCNRERESTKPGEVVFIRLDDERNGRPFANYIYDPVLLDNSTRVLKGRSRYMETELHDLVEKYFQQINIATSDQNSMRLIEMAQRSNHQSLAQSFKLIEDVGDVIDVFLELDTNAGKAMEEYLQTLQLVKSERLRKLKTLKSKLALYTISVQKKYWPNEEIEWLNFIRKEDVERFYDANTGFNRDRKLTR